MSTPTRRSRIRTRTRSSASLSLASTWPSSCATQDETAKSGGRPPVRAAWLRPKQTDLVPGKRQFRSRLSGSAAIAGFCPHRSRRAALPQRALQKRPEAGRSSVPSLMDNRFGEREDGQEPFVRRPSNATFLASLAECRPAQEGADQLRLSHAKLAREPVRRRSRPPPHWSDAYRR